MGHISLVTTSLTRFPGPLLLRSIGSIPNGKPGPVTQVICVSLSGLVGTALVSRGAEGNRLLFLFDLLNSGARLVEPPGDLESLICGCGTPITGVVDGHGPLQIRHVG